MKNTMKKFLALVLMVTLTLPFGLLNVSATQTTEVRCRAHLV